MINVKVSSYVHNPYNVRSRSSLHYVLLWRRRLRSIVVLHCRWKSQNEWHYDQDWRRPNIYRAPRHCVIGCSVVPSVDYNMNRKNFLMPDAPETGTSRLVPETCTCVSQSGTSFFWYKFLACNWEQLYSRTETVQHVTRTVRRDWSESCFGARNCYELASYFWCKFPVQVSWACVAGISFYTECCLRIRCLLGVCIWVVIVCLYMHCLLYFSVPVCKMLLLGAFCQSWIKKLITYLLKLS